MNITGVHLVTKQWQWHILSCFQLKQLKHAF